MSLIKTAVRWRHGTGVLFCLLALFGILALFQLPLELQPGGDRPEISISTPYLGASLSTFLTPTVIPALMGLLQDFQPKRSIKEQESDLESRELVKDKS